MLLLTVAIAWADIADITHAHKQTPLLIMSRHADIRLEILECINWSTCDRVRSRVAHIRVLLILRKWIAEQQTKKQQKNLKPNKIIVVVIVAVAEYSNRIQNTSLQAISISFCIFSE